MKAILLTKIGNLKNLIIGKTENLVTKSGEVLVKVDYCGVNHLDLLIIEGKRPTSGKFPLILGSEIVGRRVDTKEKVVIYPWIFCGKCKLCLSGYENICDQGGTIGRTRSGGFTEFVSVPVKNIVNIPKEVDPKLICASTLSAITAFHMIERAKIPNGTTVLVNGATGGVGTAAIQILKHKKCKVIVRTSKKEKVENLKKIGADIVLVNKVPESVPYIIDAMGGDVWSKSVGILSKNGTIVFCATTLDDLGTVNIGLAFSKQLNIRGSYGGTREDLTNVINLIKLGVIKPVIDSVYPLAEVPEALKKLEDQKAFGKILIKVN